MLLEPKPTVGGKIVIPQESADVNDLGHQPRCGDRADPTDLLERLDCHVRLILPRCQVETNYPWPGYSFLLSDVGPPSPSHPAPRWEMPSPAAHPGCVPAD